MTFCILKYLVLKVLLFYRYVWNSQYQSFECLSGLDDGRGLETFFQNIDGIPASRVEARRQLYGPNTVTVEVPSYLSLLVELAR